MGDVSLVIAVDGPAASGKGTIARALARHYKLPHLDTGLLYRAVGQSLLRAGVDLADAERAAAHAAGLTAGDLDDPCLRAEETGRAASVVSAHPRVRSALMDWQRAFVRQPGGAVLDGRDIGTVIAPGAIAKLFVTAPAEVRAQRRARETGRDYAEVLSDIRTRDARDLARALAPLARARDADLLDTGALSIDDAVRRAVEFVEARINSR